MFVNSLKLEERIFLGLRKSPSKFQHGDSGWEELSPPQQTESAIGLLFKGRPCLMDVRLLPEWVQTNSSCFLTKHPLKPKHAPESICPLFSFPGWNHVLSVAVLWNPGERDITFPSCPAQSEGALWYHLGWLGLYGIRGTKCWYRSYGVMVEEGMGDLCVDLQLGILAMSVLRSESLFTLDYQDTLMFC